MKTFLTALFFAACVCVLHAHKDRSVTLEGSLLVGLPRAYDPASLDTTAGTVTIGGRATRIPSFALPLLDPSESADLRLTASWQHDRKEMPLYLRVSIAPRDRDYSLDLLFNLETAEIFQAEVCVRHGGGSVQYLPLDLTALSKGGQTDRQE
jgi:hypothetical protein